MGPWLRRWAPSGKPYLRFSPLPAWSPLISAGRGARLLRMVTTPTPMRHTPTTPSGPSGKCGPVTGRAGPFEIFVPSTEVLGVGVGVGGGVGVVTGATTGSSPTSVVAVEVLFARFGSASFAFTVAMLWRVPGSNPPV